VKGLDPTVQVAAIGIVTTLVTTTGVVLVAILNNKRERSGSAEAGVVIALRERLALKDEIIRDLRDDKSELEEENEDLRARLRRCQEGRQP
jgi:hypothetical protein